jgi:hypothetical protein
MTSVHLIAGFFSIAFAVFLLLLLRRDHLHVRQATFWLAITFLILVVGLVPGLIDKVGSVFGIAYPPIFFALGAVLVLLLKVFDGDLAITRMERQIRRLSQRLAILDPDAPDDDE